RGGYLMATLERQIAGDIYDAQQSGSTVTLYDGALNANAATQHIGLLFWGCSPLEGATINEAHLEVYFTSGAYDDPYVYIKVHHYGNRVQWYEDANGVSGASKVT